MKYTKDNPLRVVTLCSGYDSQCLALDRVKELATGFDYELIAWSEFDPESKTPLERQPAVIAHNALFPQWADRNLGDMTKIDWTKVADFDLLFYSTPCFVAGTLVMTDEGFKKIEDIGVNDMVLSHDRQFHKVCDVGKKQAECIIRVKGLGIDEILCTPNHPFYVREMYRYGHKSIRAFREPQWKQAAGLTKKDYLGIAINQDSKIPEWNGTIRNNWGRDIPENKIFPLLGKEDFWYVMGRYVGDGWTRNDDLHKQAVICFSDRNADEFVDKVKALGFNPTVTTERTSYRCTINSKELMQFVDRYGHYAYGKRIDGETMSLPRNLLSAFLEGYIDSDGCYIQSQNEYKICTVSKELAYGVQQIVAKVYNAPSRIYKTRMPKKTIIEGREVNQRDFYQVSWHTDRRKQDHAFYENGYIWYPCNGIEATELQEFVYNMEVEDSHSYTANGTIVHNCQSISQAGLQHGFTEGSGTRSSIIWNVRDAVKEKRPKFLILENVKAMVSKKFLPMFNLWQEELSKLGYVNFAKVLNSKDYGVPQNRERIFLVSIRDDGDMPTYTFPQPFPLEKHLIDVLEDEVDEKYFISDKMLSYFRRVSNDSKSKKSTTTT